MTKKSHVTGERDERSISTTAVLAAYPTVPHSGGHVSVTLTHTLSCGAASRGRGGEQGKYAEDKQKSAQA